MKKYLAVIALGLALAVMASTAMASVGKLYVETKNGEPIQVRREPSLDAEVVGTIAYGELVTIEDYTNKLWAEILFDYDGGTYPAYLRRVYLSKTDPYLQPSATPKPKTTPKPTAKPEEKAARQALEALNRNFREMEQVEPYQATVQTSRVGGQVNFRWAPSVDTQVIDTLENGRLLTVLAQNDTWAQAQDSETGMIGFISIKYLEQVVEGEAAE